MARNRVMSFMNTFSNRDKSPTPTLSPSSRESQLPRQDNFRPPKATPPPQQPWNADASDSPQARAVRDRAPGDRVSSRPMSMVQTYQPPLMELTGDTLPELSPIFTYLNSHGNKLYQEGYFLKLDDQNSLGKPNTDRTWTECFAQLVGTILSLWDAAELDAAGQEGEVLPKFINLTDASIRIMEPLPTRANGEPPLQNVLSLSTAGKNRYLLHFNSHHSLIQWTAGIRLAIFEYTTLQEAYTGALIAGKGKGLNNINIIMERSKFNHEDWVRVRFGAGTPWRRCWCVITPPDEKEYQKLTKELNKKKSVYDRSKPPVLKGDIKFYDTKKTKKVKPLAQITNAYSAFAIYPQSKPLIDASTLIKIEGKITIHSNPPTSTEGFVFVMPEVHAAVSGFEMMLRWLFPAWDTFALYGRPARLIADTLDPRSLMFAMPSERRYGYLEVLDVTNLILTDGSDKWTEMEWRRRMKEMTQRRMTAISSGSREGSRRNSRRNTRNSVGPSTSRNRVGFDDGSSVRSNPGNWAQGPPPAVPMAGIPRTDSAPPAVALDGSSGPYGYPPHQHHRSISESQGLDRYPNENPSAHDGAYEVGPPPPLHNPRYSASSARRIPGHMPHRDMMESPERLSGEDNLAPGRSTPVRELQDLQITTTPEPVARPPTFAHAPGTLPASKPYHSPELRKANIRMSHDTLSHMTTGGAVTATAAVGALGMQGHRLSEERRRPNTGDSQRGVHHDTNNPRGMLANPNGPNEGMVAARYTPTSLDNRALPPPPAEDSYSNSAYGSQQYQAPSVPSKDARSSFDNQQQLYSGSAALSGSSHSNRAPPSVAQGTVPRSSYEQAQGHGHSSSTDSTRELSRLQTTSSILRKPLPNRNSASNAHELARSAELETASSLGSLEHHVFDLAAFDKVVPRNQRQESPERVQQQPSNASIYEDAVSTTSPDYASTIQSDPRESVERPRAGMMRTVGGKVSQNAPGRSSIDIPTVDFGPTLNYAAAHPPREPSPGRKELPRPQDSYQVQPPANRSRPMPEQTQHRPESNAPAAAKIIAWKPGMATTPGANPPGGRLITPEQFVQQRAASATGQYTHQRQQSSVNTMRTGTPTPPPGKNPANDYTSHSRNSSAEALQRPNSRGPTVALGSGEYHLRNNSGDLLQRPSSRGPSNALGASGTGDASTRLSAREQEHVARITGQPLINMAVKNRSSSPGSGLVGAIGARERERREIKQGLTSQTVQQEIARRQQAQMQQQGTPPQPIFPPQQYLPYQQSQQAPQLYGQVPHQQYRAPVQYQGYAEASPPYAQPQQRQSFMPPGYQVQQRIPTPEQLQRQQQEQYLMQQRNKQNQGR